MYNRLEGSLLNQVLCSAVAVSGFNPRRTTRSCSLHRARLPPPPPRLNQALKGNVRLQPRTSTALDRGWALRLRLLVGCVCWTRWEAAIAAGPGLPSSTTGQQNNPAAGTELLAAVWVRRAAMGSVLSSDSGKSPPASATPRALERRGAPELPVTSFDCSVCLEVLHQPVRTRCGHVFCRSCIATSLKNNKWTCPYCRAYLPSEGVPAMDVAKRMKSEYQNCTECDTLVCLSEMRAHIRTCQKYIDKYGPLQELGETATRCVCPFCQKELDEHSLLDHCIAHHRSERRPVFCPLCRLMPNENSNSINGSLIRHLQVSHTLFYDDFIDFNIIEEALIRRVLDRSLLEYVNHSNTT